jgi:hypothetical protein
MLKVYLEDVNQDRQLAQDADYRTVMEHLRGEAKNRAWQKLCLKRFSRYRQLYQPTYELTRQGKLPESDTLAGSLLNMLLGEDSSSKTRRQRVDGSKLPQYQQVEHYFLPGGSLGVREDSREFQGWFFVGFLLGKGNGGVAKRPGE